MRKCPSGLVLGGYKNPGRKDDSPLPFQDANDAPSIDALTKPAPQLLAVAVADKFPDLVEAAGLAVHGTLSQVFYGRTLADLLHFAVLDARPNCSVVLSKLLKLPAGTFGKALLARWRRRRWLHPRRRHHRPHQI